jgi:hypothetical protein
MSSSSSTVDKGNTFLQTVGNNPVTWHCIKSQKVYILNKCAVEIKSFVSSIIYMAYFPLPPMEKKT